MSTNFVKGDELHTFSYRYYDCLADRNVTRFENITTTRTSRYRFSYRYSDAVTVFRAYSNKLLVEPADNNIRTIKYSGQQGSKAASFPFAIYPLNLEEYV